MRLILTFAGALAASPALGWTPCEDLWFSRNQVYDRAGYCFASPLGTALFDNAGCSGTTVVLTPEAQALVDFVRAREAELGCAVDTGQTTLDIPNLWMRQQLETPVALSEFASGCLGWQGPAFELRAGPSLASPVLTEARPGDDLVWDYQAFAWPEGWSFLTLYRGAEQVGLGWHQGRIDEALCTGTAG